MNADATEEVILAVDMILEAIIGLKPGRIDELIAEAESGEVRLSLSHFALYCAVHSVRAKDNLNARRFANLLRLVEIIPDEPQYLGIEERKAWVPSPDEVDHWRGAALQ